MSLDPKKLRQDAQRLQGARSASGVGRETLGTTKAVRAALPVIYELRKTGVSWPAIAEALGAQGVVQGRDRVPLTTNRLTALVTQIEDQARRKAEKVNNRSRSDSAVQPVERAKPLSLSPDLANSTSHNSQQPSSTEEDLRRDAFQRLQSVLKKED